MEPEQREHVGYELVGSHHAGQWQVHIYGDDKVPPIPGALPATSDPDKERAFAKAEQRINDFLACWVRLIGDRDSPTLRARRS